MDKAMRTELHTPIKKSFWSQLTSTTKAWTQDSLGKTMGEVSKVNLARKEPEINSGGLKILNDCKY